MRKARFIGLVLVVAALILVYRFSVASGSGVKQPIEYNHKKHIALGMECTGCHEYAMTDSFAGIPDVDDCMVCHQAPVSDSPEAKKIAKYAEVPGGIPWQRIYSVPADVFFSHRRHARLGKIGCEVCHGDVENQTKPVERPVRKITMDWCVTCHEKVGASTDCLACHK